MTSRLQSLEPLLEAGWKFANLDEVEADVSHRIRAATYNNAEPYKLADEKLRISGRSTPRRRQQIDDQGQLGVPTAWARPTSILDNRWSCASTFFGLLRGPRPAVSGAVLVAGTTGSTRRVCASESPRSWHSGSGRCLSQRTATSMSGVCSGAKAGGIASPFLVMSR